MSDIKEDVQRTLDEIARRLGGPGGVIAVIPGRRGYRRAHLRIRKFRKTDLERNPLANVAAKGDVRQQLNHHLKEILPQELTKNGEMIDSGELTLEHLCNMQSGLRDYWAMTTLWGAKPEDEFVIERDGPLALARTKSFQSEPGTSYSYSNLNFYILARVIERVTGESLDTLLQERILGPAGMKTASLSPNTAEYPATCVGYEGTEESGFVAAVNRLQWSGESGLVASLNDMIAYEKHIDQCHSDPESWYRAAISQPKFKDGSPADYSYGLSHLKVDDLEMVGHLGCLRGYHQLRAHVPAKRLSVVVAVNTNAELSWVQTEVLLKFLNVPVQQLSPIQPNEKWFGNFLDEASQLSIIVTRGSCEGEISMTYSDSPYEIPLTTENHAQDDNMTATIDGDTLTIVNRNENLTFTAQRIVPDVAPFWDTTPFHGVYKCDVVESTFHCTGVVGTIYGAFDGYLGEGSPTFMRCLGTDVFHLPCPRGLDAPAPGNWTVRFTRNDENEVDGVIIGCILARRIVFKRV